MNNIIPIERSQFLIRNNHGGTFRVAKDKTTDDYGLIQATNTVGYFVGLSNGASGIPEMCLTPEFIRNWIFCNPKVRSGEFLLGVYEDQQTGLWCIERSIYCQYLTQAKRIAEMHFQYSIWDIAANEEVIIREEV